MKVIYYASVVYAYLASLGVELIAEDVTNRARIDLTLRFDEKIYLIEFKVEDEEPLKHIKEKKYYEKYLYNAPKKLDNKFPNNLSTWIEYEEIKKEGKYHEQETQKL